MAPRRHYEFGPFILDTVAGLLFRGGDRLALRPKVLEILRVLVEAQGNLVTREQLLEKVWAGTIVEETTLVSHISVLRKALGEGADGERFIETIPKRGYRFVAPVKIGAGEDSAAQAAVERAPFASAKWKTARNHKLVGATLAVLLAVGLFVLHRWGQWPVAASARPRISSIAVLPLENLSHDPEQEYFADGMTDEIITDLAKLPGLRVISRASTAQYKGTHKPLGQIAHELNVDGIVEGTALRVGNRVRIRAQLIYAPSDKYVWAEAYERDFKDVLNLQATLARDIAGEIRLKLTPQQATHLVAAHPVDPEAHEFYLKGRFFWNKRNEDGLNKAVAYFQKAIAKDSSYAAAQAGSRGMRRLRVARHDKRAGDQRPAPGSGPPDPGRQGRAAREQFCLNPAYFHS